jgi:hypothetical protein
MFLTISALWIVALGRVKVFSVPFRRGCCLQLYDIGGTTKMTCNTVHLQFDPVEWDEVQENKDDVNQNGQQLRGLQSLSNIVFLW